MVQRECCAAGFGLLERDVTAPIIGATKVEQLEDSIGALSVELSNEEIASLEAPYVPHPVVGFY